MDLKSFKDSLAQAAPPTNVGGALAALWRQAKGDWDEAHRLVQEMADSDAWWVHAYLHRVEGDRANASYWYRRAGKPAPSAPLDKEWEEIVSVLLEE